MRESLVALRFAAELRMFLDRRCPGTRRSYDTFARCRSCGHLYWHGAHARRLAALVVRARVVVGARR